MLICIYYSQVSFKLSLFFFFFFFLFFFTNIDNELCYYAIPKIKLVIMDNRKIAESGVKIKKNLPIHIKTSYFFTTILFHASGEREHVLFMYVMLTNRTENRSIDGCLP